MPHPYPFLVNVIDYRTTFVSIPAKCASNRSCISQCCLGHNFSSLYYACKSISFAAEGSRSPCARSRRFVFHVMSDRSWVTAWEVGDIDGWFLQHTAFVTRQGRPYRILHTPYRTSFLPPSDFSKIINQNYISFSVNIKFSCLIIFHLF